MPFRSEEQRGFIWAKHPDIARRWTKKYGSKIVTSAIKHKRKKKKG